ncbi:hypothetical protein GEV33_000966 [Tenebrio molitor]|uniref:NR LBD domain-containing protein n=1 Tax=Tenebrio molitor TaxID=7067 RepID=A0A8J6LH58_TENMO|nr:hypothetical protein GEV33_000966 [Tenebrio molitor]
MNKDGKWENCLFHVRLILNMKSHRLQASGVATHSVQLLQKWLEEIKRVLSETVQHERGPRNSTLRRQQMSNYYNEGRVMVSPPGSALNLAVPKYEPSIMDPAVSLLPPVGFLCNNFLPPPPQIPSLPLPPVFVPPMLNPSAICESAAQLLFMNVQWVRSIPAFTSLPLSDQLLLLEESWLDLFLLGAAQFLPLIDFSVLVQACGVLQQEPHRSEIFLKEILTNLPVCELLFFSKLRLVNPRHLRRTKKKRRRRVRRSASFKMTPR